MNRNFHSGSLDAPLVIVLTGRAENGFAVGKWHHSPWERRKINLALGHHSCCFFLQSQPHSRYVKCCLFSLFYRICMKFSLIATVTAAVSDDDLLFYSIAQSKMIFFHFTIHEKLTCVFIYLICVNVFLVDFTHKSVWKKQKKKTIRSHRSKRKQLKKTSVNIDTLGFFFLHSVFFFTFIDWLALLFFSSFYLIV